MADVYWTGDQSGDVTAAANYSTTYDGSSPPGTAPGLGDRVFLAQFVSEEPAVGTSDAHWDIGDASIYGGTYNGNIENCNAVWNGTFNGTVNCPLGEIHDGTFNGAVTAATHSGGTFNSSFTLSGNIAGGTIGVSGYGSCADVTSGDIYGAVSASTFGGGTIKNTGSISCSYWANGVVEGSIATNSSTLYAATSTAAAAANKVLIGNQNLGVNGTLTLPTVGKVLAPTSYGIGGNGSTGTLALPAESDVRAGVEYGESGDGSLGTMQASRSSPRGMWF